MNLSIIIVSYNTRDMTRDCLISIHESNIELEYEIIVIDNHSSDGSVEMIRESFPDVLLIANDENKMFARANNQGVKHAAGECVLLLNSDTIIESGNIEKLYAFYEANVETVGCIGPQVLNEDRTIQSEAYCHESLRQVLCNTFGVVKWPIFRGLKKRILPEGYPRFMMGETRKSGWVTGCCMLIPHKVLNQVGGLDEAFIFYHEDVEFCFRVKTHGLSVWCCPEAKVVHLGGGSTTSEIKAELSDIALAQRALYIEKTIGFRHWRILAKWIIYVYYPLIWVLRVCGMSDVERIYRNQRTKTKSVYTYLKHHKI